MELSSYNLFKPLRESGFLENISRPIIIADDIRTPENMGAILRLAANIGAGKVFIISAKAGNFKNYKIAKTASGAEKKIEWEIIENYSELIHQIKESYSLLAIETSQHSQSIFNFIFPENCAFVLGNEVTGIRPEILQKCDNQLHIPIPGAISSLNVTHALAVALFEWLRGKMK